MAKAAPQGLLVLRAGSLPAFAMPNLQGPRQMSAHEVFTEALHIIQGGQRTSSVIAAAIKSSTLTVNEMGQILGAITDRICATACGKYPENPELEAIAHDLAETCEEFALAQDQIDERKYEDSLQEPEHEPIEEGDWK